MGFGGSIGGDTSLDKVRQRCRSHGRDIWNRYHRGAGAAGARMSKRRHGGDVFRCRRDFGGSQVERGWFEVQSPNGVTVRCPNDGERGAEEEPLVPQKKMTSWPHGLREVTVRAAAPRGVHSPARSILCT